VKKVFKIIITVCVIVLVAITFSFGIVFLDIASYGATGAETLPVSGTSIGKALVVYNPGLSGATKNLASKVAENLQLFGYTVTLAGVKSQAATETLEYSVIVVGSPIYAGTPTSSIKDYLSKLSIDEEVRLGFFGSGSGEQDDSDIAQIRNSIEALPNGDVMATALVVKIGSGENADQRSLDFVDELLS
jgi:flavorubredoxin